MTGVVLRPAALTAAAFAPFGDVIQAEGRDGTWINDHTCRRFDDLATVDVAEGGGRPLISLFEARPRPLPFAVRLLERHPLSSQAFFPLDARPFIVLVAESDAAGRAGSLHAFRSSGMQGVNYRRNTWHHPLIALHRSRFLVVDRGGAGANCEEWLIEERVTLAAEAPPA